jgi:hypothetical protein
MAREEDHMLQKKALPGRKVEVTFRMPPMDEVVELYLSGDFSGWQVKGIPFTLDTDGTWVARLVLDAGTSYRFRYHDNQGRWMNDGEADGSVPNNFGSEDSIVDLTGAAWAEKGKPGRKAAVKKSATPKAAARKTAARKSTRKNAEQ